MNRDMMAMLSKFRLFCPFLLICFFVLTWRGYLYLNMIVEHVIGARFWSPVGGAHSGTEFGIVVADPLQAGRAEAGGWHLSKLMKKLWESIDISLIPIQLFMA